MISSACFRAANTVRVTLPKPVRNALGLQPKMRVLFTIRKPGVVELRNADDLITAGLVAAARP
jgi:bifunctional DNA-binding transcriptional regulator/antitoxin component of YhaV-PrlF toxin-antitoxin module